MRLSKETDIFFLKCIHEVCGVTPDELKEFIKARRLASNLESSLWSVWWALSNSARNEILSNGNPSAQVIGGYHIDITDQNIDTMLKRALKPYY